MILLNLHCEAIVHRQGDRLVIDPKSLLASYEAEFNKAMAGLPEDVRQTMAEVSRGERAEGEWPHVEARIASVRVRLAEGETEA